MQNAYVPLAGKTALITGGASGIGRAIAECFVGAGASVAIFDIDEAGAEAAAAALTASGAAFAISGDVSREADSEHAVRRTAERFGSIDVLVNNAGIEFYSTVADLTAEQWDRQLNVNLRGAFLCSKHAMPYLSRKGGVILNISSVHATVSYPASPAYDASKAGLLGLTRAMALDHGPAGVRVNTVCPGYIDTPMMHLWLSSQPDPDAARRELLHIHPVGRIGTGRDVAEACVFLASDAASFISGTHLVVDGGMTAVGR